MSVLKLTIELVPTSCWYNNVRSHVSKTVWDKIRKATYKAANYKCKICGGIGARHPVECHERWEYDESTWTQCLVGMQALCPRCHEVKHIGRAELMGRLGVAMAHFRRVNSCSVEVAEKHFEDSVACYRRRSACIWELDISFLCKYGVDQETE